LDLFDFNEKCKLVITDSGSIQEEATSPSIRKPVLVMRLPTERQEAVESRFAKVVGQMGKIFWQPSKKRLQISLSCLMLHLSATARQPKKLSMC
jgi:UDP-N-acetylglucosamine 2-epimerase